MSSRAVERETAAAAHEAPLRGPVGGPPVAEHALALQRSAGNRAVAALLQRKIQEQNFPGGGQVDEPSDDEFVFWNFDVGSATLKPEHRDAVATIAARIRSVLGADTDAQIDIEGEASATGAFAANDSLAARRATAVRAALVTAGVDEQRIQQTSTGSLKSQPQETQRGLAMSRAVRVIVVRPAAAPGLTAATGGCNCLIPLDLLGGQVTLKTISFGPRQLSVLRAGDGTQANPGMTVTATPMFDPPKCARGGALVFVQNVMPFREIVYRDGSRVTLRTSVWHLDKGDPYPSQVMFGLPVANDSPAMGVPTDDVKDVMTVEVRDHYRMFFLVRRPQGDATIQVGDWTWVGLARNSRPGVPNGQLVLDTAFSRVVPASGKGRHVSDAPAKSPHLSALRFVAETGGLPHDAAISVKQAELLNRVLGSLGPPAPTPKTTSSVPTSPIAS